MLNHRERRSIALASPPLLPAGLRSPISPSGLTPEQALDNLRSGLDYFFGETCTADLAAQMDVERSRIHELRDAIAARLEAEFAILDALTPDPDLEDGADDEPSLGALNQLPCDTVGFDGAYTPARRLDPNDQRGWAAGSNDDREAGDDNGIVDAAGAWQQGYTDEPFAYGFTGWHRLTFGGAR